MLETAYQSKLVDRIQSMFPGCFIMRNDPSQQQGLPDLLILYGTTWAMLEVKISADAPEQPNQPYWVDFFNNMSFAAFIHPQIEEQVLYAMGRALDCQRVA
jgi:hypothetical protein